MIKIKHLVILAGPSCSGKSVLISRIRKGQAPDFCKEAGIADPCSLYTVEADKLENLADTSVDEMLIHYGFGRQWKAGSEPFGPLINQSDQAVIVTMLITPKTLVARVKRRILGVAVSTIYRPLRVRQIMNRIATLWRKMRSYRDGSTLVALYENWFRMTREFSQSNHLVLDVGESRESIRPYDAEHAGAFLRSIGTGIQPP